YPTLFRSRWKMPARYYSKNFRLKGGEEVLLAFIDTNPLIPEFYQNKEYGPHVANQQPEKQLAWLDELLGASTARWKIVVGHHPIYTAGPRTENYDHVAVLKVLNTILDLNRIPVYLSGHEHSLQPLKLNDNPTHQFISVAGSEIAPMRDDPAYSRYQASAFLFKPDGIN